MSIYGWLFYKWAKFFHWATKYKYDPTYWFLTPEERKRRLK